MKLHSGLIIGPTFAFVVTALIIRFESQECATCKLPKKVDKVLIGSKIDYRYNLGREGALLVVVGECRSCAMKHVDRKFLTKCINEDYQVTFVESIFNNTRTQPLRDSFEGMPVTSIPYFPFQELTTSFLPRLVIVDRQKRVLAKQQAIDEVIMVPNG